MTEGLGDILLNNRKYRVDIASWREKDIIDFAPRATTPGGSTVMSDLNLYQPLVQTDWQHGMGFHWYSDASGYLTTNGNIDTRQDGLVMMMTQAVSSDTNDNLKQGFCTFNNKLYAWGTAGLRQYDAGSWTSIYSTGPVNFAMNGGDYLFFCPDNARIQKMSAGNVVTDAGLDSNATDYKWLIIHNGFIYAGKDGTNHVHRDSNADLSGLEGTTADTDIIYCGIGNVPTLGAIVYSGNLYVSRQDGLWIIGEDLIARRVIDLSGEISSNNFRSMGIMNGYLYFTVRDRISQWNGARVNDATPRKITDTYPYVTYGQFDNFVSSDNFLYMTARTNEATYNESLLCFDGVGYHKLMDLVTNGTDSITAMGFDVVNNRLWYHLDTASDITYYISFQNRSPFPYANFPTTGTHSLITSRMDMGFRRIKKSMPSLLVEARNVTTARYISVYFQLDGDGTWVFWDNVVSNGITELKFPGSRRTKEFDYALLRFDFVTDSTAQSPVMESFTMRFIMRPNVALGFNFWVIAANNFQSGVAEDERDAATIRSELIEARNSKSPIRFIDLLGVEHFGYITTMVIQPISREITEESNIMEYRIQLNFVEV